ncbi:hypothetical protein [Litorilituus lipolyticus]|uniref:Uncharacterized protein n=1 Tax=Litorilituus lipolyticus TaxID=2491017 RepID=A0A502L4W8_9GAMM|nr:hypothetical protein [Litorilituus lipolyticus]TPH18968.1 hypothetical protein EPA86_01340 [Litorilituus lipolyticus]
MNIISNLDKRMLLAGVGCAVIILLIDIFNRVLLPGANVKEKEDVNIEIVKFNRTSINGNDFINQYFSSLLAIEKELEQKTKAAQDKLANDRLAKSQQNKAIVKPDILRVAKLVGVISQNGERKAVIEYKNKTGKISLITLPSGKSFAEGKVTQVGVDFVEIEIEGTLAKLPLFKNKNMTFSGEKNKGK